MATIVISLLRQLKLPELVFRDALLLDVACALTVHRVYKRYEPDASLIPVHVFLLIALPSIPAAFFVPHFHGTELAVLSAFALFYSSLLTSIVLYRLSPWHPLAKYPGPVLARISKFWALSIMAKGKNNIYIKQLHATYGQHVRIGPNEISTIDASVIPNILGADGMPKGPMWAARTPKGEPPSLIGIQTMHEHARRRKKWNRAFNTTAMKSYEPMVQKRALQLVNELEKRSTKADVPEVDLAKWLSYFTTDFMGDMAFGGGFELMRDGGDKAGVWSMIESGMRTSAILQHLPWFAPLLFAIPAAKHQLFKLLKFTMNLVNLRKANGSLTKDLFYHIIDEEHIEKVPPSDEEVILDGVLAIIAGSDTTSTTLSGLFCFLLSNPQEYKRLQDEIDNMFPPGEGDPFDAVKLAAAPLLNAVINETLRLQPAVPSYLQRAPEVGSGGKWVGDSFLPEGTSVIIPPYVLFRDSAYFSPNPDSFWPERWIQPTSEKSIGSYDNDAIDSNSKMEVITNSAAFIPFSYGPANCAGRALALLEMRMVVALMMQHFEIQFAPGYDPKEWEEHLEDFYVVANGPLPVKLTPRT